MNLRAIPNKSISLLVYKLNLIEHLQAWCSSIVRFVSIHQHFGEDILTFCSCLRSTHWMTVSRVFACVRCYSGEICWYKEAALPISIMFSSVWTHFLWRPMCHKMKILLWTSSVSRMPPRIDPTILVSRHFSAASSSREMSIHCCIVNFGTISSLFTLVGSQRSSSIRSRSRPRTSKGENVSIIQKILQASLTTQISRPAIGFAS